MQVLLAVMQGTTLAQDASASSNSSTASTPSWGDIIQWSATNTDAIQALCAILQVFLALVAGIGIALIVHKAATRYAKLEMMRSIFDAWLQTDMFFLTNDDALKELVKFKGASEQNLDNEMQAEREAMVRFLAMNALYSIHYATKSGVLKWREKRHMRTLFSKSMAEYMKDPKMRALIGQEVYVSGFQKDCKKLHEDNVDKDKPITSRYKQLNEKPSESKPLVPIIAGHASNALTPTITSAPSPPVAPRPQNNPNRRSGRKKNRRRR